MKKSLCFTLLLSGCFLFTEICLAQEAPLLDWAKNFGASVTPYNTGNGIATDASGNVYTTGNFFGTQDFDPGPGVFNMSVTGSDDGIFILKLNSTGDFVWAKSIKNVYNTADAIAIDGSGNIIIAGFFDKGDVMDFDPGPGTFNVSAVGYDMFFLKLNSDGEFIWMSHIRGASTAAHVFPKSIVLDAGGNIYTTGYFQNTIDFDPGAGTFNITAGEFRDIFISKLDANGNFVWAKAMVGAGTCGACDDQGTAIALDASGNVYSGGFLRATADFDPGSGTFNLTPPTGGSYYVSKLDNAGNFVWAKTIGGVQFGVGGLYDMAVDASGNVYSTGHVYGTSDFDPGPGTFNLTSAGSSDIFISKLNSSGDFVWAKLFGGGIQDNGNTIDTDGLGNLYIAGNFNGTVDFDPGPGTFNLTVSGANTDYFLQKLDTDGNFVWAYGMNIGYETSIKVQLPNIYVFGQLANATSDADPGPCVFNITNASFGVFVKKLHVGIAPSAPTITSFTPSVGPIGTSITITGTNFSATPSENTVRFFNNRTATVTASTTTSITVTVPAAATNGKVSVTTDCVTASSTLDFIVTDNFVTQWNLATAGSGATQLTFGTATSGTATYTWQQLPSGASGSGSWSGSTLTISGLPTNATIRLLIAPANFQRININNGADRNRLIQVEQWGNVAWTSMQTAFRNCLNLQITATDIPNLTGVSNMSEMFSGCDILNSPSNIGSWNTGAVTTMQRMFANTDAFNQNIGTWNTAAVTNMSEMFSSARAFNQPIGGWNTAAVTDMSGMFFYADVFNQDIGAWNTSAVTNMSDMFTEAYAFNQNIGSWNTGSVTNMSNMFSEAIAFNQDISSWSTAAVTNMSGMFKFASVFNQNIGVWNTAAVTTMSQMFSRASAFNQNLSSWNTAAVTSMLGMFEQATAFNQNIGAWTLNPGVDLRFMFDDNGLDCNNYSSTLIGWSANTSTPNGRSLGASGRQYGTNAVAARNDLDITKSWIITGDAPSGGLCVSGPSISNFTPPSGPVGTTVTINGTNFSTTPASNIVLFNGIAAAVSASTATSITVAVPAGATTGKISVTVDGITATSTNDFTVTTTGNQPPVISSTTASVPVNGIVTIELLSLLSDPDDNLDVSTLSLTSNTSEQGAAASINASSELVLDYGSVIFIGVDRVSIEVCDLLSACAQQLLSIEVEGDVIIYNAISPNADNKNDMMHIANIELFSNNHVSVFNRWGDLVFETDNYNNDDRAFKGLNKNGKQLPSGIYYYKIELSGSKTKTGYLSLKQE
jgi:gliding motility-associated-like protein